VSAIRGWNIDGKKASAKPEATDTVEINDRAVTSSPFAFADFNL
jgi:hypothetical protein